MAIAYDQTVKLTISAQTEGDEKVLALAQQIEALGKEGGEAAPKFLALADELKILASQKVRIDGLETAISGAKQAWGAFREARQEVETLDKALADAKGAGASRQAISLLQGELKSANRELASAEKAWTRQKDVLDSARSSAASAGVDTKNLAAEQARLTSALTSASQAAAEQQSAFEARKAAMAAQMAEEDRLAQIVEMNKTRQMLAAQELLEVEKRAYAEAQAAAARATAQRAEEAAAVEAYANRTKKALSDAFSTAGVRSTAAIEADILQVNQALLKLASNAKVSGTDFDRAFAAGQARIEVLRAEMDSTGGASARLSATTKTLSGEFAGLVAQLGGVYLAFQAGGLFVTANAQAESFARTMTLLTGNVEKATAEMEYVRAAANRLGIDVSEASKSYAQLTAATKGTALEGDGARRVFEAVSGAMATLGKSSAETNDALRAVNQMASKGTVAMEELKGQLGEHLPGAMKAAANGAGLTVAELTKMVESGSVLAEDLLPALAKGLTDMYGVGKANNDTFVAQWARLKNAITDTMQVIGDTGLFRALVVVIEQVGIAIGGLTGAFVLLGKTFGITAGAIATFDWKHPIDSIARWKEAVSQAADEVQAKLDKQKKAVQGAADAQQAAGTAAEEAGKKAVASSSNWLQVENAYTQVEQASKKQIDNLKTLSEARDAEAASLKAFADTFGTQVEKLDAATAAAKTHEEALRALDAQVRADLEIAKSKLAALEQERDSDGKLTESKEKLRETLQKTIESKQAEADKTTQATAAAHSATLQAEAANSVYADHAKQVYALRDAWQAAETEYQRLSALNAQGVNVSAELKAADEARAKALLLYRDALADATAAAERHVAAEKSAAGIQQSALQNDLYRANTILEVAKQRGNEKEIAQAQIAVWRIELEISEAQAVAAKKEAEAMEIVAKAKRAELEASGGLTEAKKAELDLMEANVRAKQLEAEKYDLVADRMRKLSYETNELKSSFGDLSSSADQAAASADRAAASYDGLASSIRSAGQAKDGFVRNTNGEVVTTGPNVPALAVRNTQTPEQARVFEEVFNYYYQKASQDPSNYSSLQGLQYGAIEQQAAAAAAAEAQRRTAAAASSTAASNQPAVSTPTRSTSAPVIMNVNLGSIGTRTLKLDSYETANAVVSVLQELARVS
ncbi:tape measure protein [Zoogloea sp.]|uniref:tape measure protein n=1 Tax=Zoogloea sp. TaxID=49181 RepID=UPI0035B0CD6A